MNNSASFPLPGTVPISVVILTKDEALNIEACIDSCQWCDDVHVLDSGSSDATESLAQARGISTHQNPFQSFGAQRNWAIDNIPTRYAWQFHLDADERFTPEQVAEMAAEIGTDGQKSAKAGYYVPSKLMFLGRWLRYSGGYPTYQMRFFHRERCRFIDYGHGQREDAHGEIASLEAPYLHFNFSKGVEEWFTKHNRYSTLEAREGLSRRHQAFHPWRRVLRSRGIERRRALKEIFYTLPARPLWRFFGMYVVKSGWRDGSPGLSYCLLMSIYDFMIEIKMHEMEHPT